MARCSACGARGDSYYSRIGHQCKECDNECCEYCAAVTEESEDGFSAWCTRTCANEWHAKMQAEIDANRVQWLADNGHGVR